MVHYLTGRHQDCFSGADVVVHKVKGQQWVEVRGTGSARIKFTSPQHDLHILVLLLIFLFITLSRFCITAFVKQSCDIQLDPQENIIVVQHDVRACSVWDLIPDLILDIDPFLSTYFWWTPVELSSTVFLFTTLSKNYGGRTNKKGQIILPTIVLKQTSNAWKLS